MKDHRIPKAEANFPNELVLGRGTQEVDTTRA